MRRFILLVPSLVPLALSLAALSGSSADAHRSGCHRWHSCGSDSGSYTCGDTGHSNYCDSLSTPAAPKRTTVYPSSSSTRVNIPPVLPPASTALPLPPSTPVVPFSAGMTRVAILNDGPVKFRLKPSAQGQILFKLERGARVNLDACGVEWCAVRYQGKSGWMMKKFLSF